MTAAFATFFEDKFADLLHDDERPRGFGLICRLLEDQWRLIRAEMKAVFESRAEQKYLQNAAEVKSCRAIFEAHLKFCESAVKKHETTSTTGVKNQLETFLQKATEETDDGEVEVEVEVIGGRELLQCCQCDDEKRFRIGALLKHILMTHEKVMYKCEKCAVSFAQISKRHQHFAVKHMNLARRKPPNSALFPCSDCDAEFETKAKLKYHRLKTHLSWQGDLKCPTCDKTYSSKSNLTRHINRDHKGGKSPAHSCPECGFVSGDRFHLEVHRRKHSGIRPFRCEECKFGFYKKSDLKKHRCEGRAKLGCDSCGESFRFRRQKAEHALYSARCGSLAAKYADVLPAMDPPSDSRYMTSTPSIVRFNVGKDSVVSVNCDREIDERLFEKRKKRSKCGVCAECEAETDCGKCDACLRNGESGGKKRKKTCEAKRCKNLVEQYVAKRGKETEAKNAFQ